MTCQIIKIFYIHKYASYVKKIISQIRSSRLIKELRKQGLLIDDTVDFVGQPIVTLHNGSRIEIGAGVWLISQSTSTALGVNHPCIIRTMAENAEIVIKNNAGMSGATICCASRIEIGERVMLGANVTITDTDFHSIDWEKRWTANDIEHANKAPVIIEDDVFVGMNSSILKNVRIGEKSVIGAHSVVTKNIPPYSIAVGNPARIIGNVQDYLER